MKQNHKKQYAPPALLVADLFPESRFLLSGSTGGGISPRLHVLRCGRKRGQEH